MTIPGTEWEYQHELELLDDDLKLVADRSRADETKKMVNGIERTVKKGINEPVELALSKPSTDMWDSVLKTYRDVTKSSQKTYLAKATSYNCTTDENESALKTLALRSWLALRKKLEEQTADTVVLSTLRGSFEERFRYDDQGVPRVWKPEDDLDGAFKKARDDTLTLLPIFATVKPVDSDLLPPLPSPDPDYDVEEDSLDPSTAFTLVTPTRLNSLETRFKREADAAYVEAKRSMVSSVAQIPMWIYGLLVALGWNEAMAVLFNPLYFALLVVAAASAYIILQLGLAGPLLQVTRTVLSEIRRIATEKLREAFAEPAAVGAAPSRRLVDPMPATQARGERRRAGSDHELNDMSLTDEARRRGDLVAGEMFEK